MRSMVGSRVEVGEPAGEWLFQRDGQLFGPVPAQVLIERIQRGELDPETPIASEGGVFRPLREVPDFVTAVARLEAHRKVRGELVAARRVERWRLLGRGILWSGVATVVAGAVAAGVIIYARSRTPGPALAGVRISAPPVDVAFGREEAPADDSELLEYLGGDSTPPVTRRPSPRSALSGGPPAAGVAGDGFATHGSYDEAAMNRVIKANQVRLAACVKQHAKSDPGLRGEVPLTFTVENDGKVGRLWVDKPGYARGPLHDCLWASLAEWRFPTFEGERPSISLSFRVGN